MKSTLLSIITTLVLPCFASAQMQDSLNQSVVMEYMQNQQYDLAATYLKDRIDTENPKQLSTLGYFYFMSSQLPAAESIYEKVLGLDSGNLQAHFYLGNIWMQKDQPEVAIPHYFKLIALQPQSALYHKLLSTACAEAQKPDSAFSFLKEAARLNPKDGKTIGNLGNSFVERKMFVQADSVLNAYLAIDSSQFTVVAAAVKSAYFQKQYKRVGLFGEYLMQTHIVSPTVFTYVIAASYYDRQYEQCSKVYGYMALMNQTPEAVIYYAALAKSALKQYEESTQLLQQCVSLAKSKNLGDYYAGIADNYEQLKQYKTAINHLDTAYYLFKNPIHQYSIGRIYDQHLNNVLAAKKYYHQYFVRAKPEDAQDSAIHRFVRDRMKQLAN
ncbi:hypothetical protein [uncultured Chitinophaga sp.]|uniref:tetratricopeptide repeat protein n=1 Tax=uncultured Chitinophaga sp. TaxID=339340 RepID=UPI002601540F|nr:hypothetical protein [uncultured Chitinophaga sp.]